MAYYSCKNHHTYTDPGDWICPKCKEPLHREQDQEQG